MFVCMTIICCMLLFEMLIAIVYFLKQRVDNVENSLYSKLIIITIIGLVLELCCNISIYNLDVGVFFRIAANIVNKLFIVYLLIWEFLFTEYIIYISFNSSDKFTKAINSKKFKLAIIAVIFAIAGGLIFLPLNYYNDGSFIYSYGPATTLLTAFGGVFILVDIYCFFKNLKNITSKKYIPLIILILAMIFVVVLRVINPGITIINSSFAFVTIIMYFTIENPDMAMIEQLNIARDQADRANHAKSEFLSSMSHEIRTPLNAIVGFSQALQEEDLPEQAQEEVKDIVRASESLLELVNGILDISKIEANKIEIVDGEYNIYEVLNDLTALAKARMGDKKLEFKTYFDQSIPQVLYGDSVRIKQIILNLLTNSIKYTKEGEVIFRVSSIQNNEVCRLIVSVEDTGIGIKKESIDKLFTKFQRLDLEKNKTIEGTGLGLAITKKLVELMNGRIMVQSVYGKGSKFTVALDQKIIHKEVTQEEVKKEVTDEVFDLSSKKILIVDDNKLNLKVASRLIEKYKCEIETIESGFECLDKIKAGEHFDLILMDDMMPEMGGVETFHKLKEIDNFNIPVIALTANAISGMREKYLAEGFNDYLSKPIDKAELNKVLQIIKD